LRIHHQLTSGGRVGHKQWSVISGQ
jgi:hypothetical protein